MNDRARRIANLSPEKRRLLERCSRSAPRSATDKGILTLPRYSESGQPRVFPLSSAQRLMWFNKQRPEVYNMPPQAMRLRGPLDVRRWKLACMRSAPVMRRCVPLLARAMGSRCKSLGRPGRYL